MGAATADALSGQRMVLGLGTSSMPIVGGSSRIRVQAPPAADEGVCRGDQKGTVGGSDKPLWAGIPPEELLSWLVRPKRRIPIYLAAVNQGMVNLAWEVGDGVIFYLRPLEEMRDTIRQMRPKGEIDVTCQIITCVSEDSEAAIARAKRTLAFYISVGRVYREFLGRCWV